MYRILILADIRPMGFHGFHAVVVFGLGKEFLFKSILEHCDGYNRQAKGESESRGSHLNPNPRTNKPLQMYSFELIKFWALVSILLQTNTNFYYTLT